MTKDLKKILVFLIIGFVVRLLLMPITLHSDLWAVSFSQYLFSFKGIFNIYDYLAELPANSLLILNYGRNFFTYPPLTYFTLGIFGLILKPLFNADFFNNLVSNFPNILSDSRLYWHLFLTKLPYFIFDLGILILLRNLFEGEKEKKSASILWLFNPLVLYTTYMIGQFDIIPVFFTVLCLYLVKKSRLNRAAVCLGIGGAYKMFPLFFLPFLAVNYGKGFPQKLKLLLIGLVPYFFSILPFLNSSAFRQNVLFSNQTQKMLFAKVNVSGAEYLSVFVVVYIFLLAISAVKKLDLWKWFLLVMLLFFSVTHYHPQWFLWLSPFLLIFWVKFPNLKFIPVVLTICWLGTTLLFEPSLSVSLFSPVAKSLTEINPLSEAVNAFYDVFLIKSLIRSIFAGLALAISVLFVSKNEIS